MSPRFVLPAVLVAVLVVGGAWLAVDNGPYAFKVRGDEVSQKSVNDELRALGESEALAGLVARGGGEQISTGAGSVTADLGASWLGLLVAQQFAEREVARRDLPTTGADREAGHQLALQQFGSEDVFQSLPDWFRQRLNRRWTAVAVLERDLLADPTDALLEEAAGECASGRYVSHILVQTADEAAAIKERLAVAGTDFAEVARTESGDTQSASLGGALGCLQEDGFVEPFQSVAEAQPIGVVSDPVQTEFGFHLILVTDQPSQTELEQVAVVQVFRSLLRDKNVQIDPRYGRWDRANGQVLPPSAPEPTG
jgi:parvulin-like peptidyl-prolyl cis-trans isomerase-like protein